MRIVFFGTPSFAVHPLVALARDPRVELVGVITQPDRPVGRTGTPQPTPVRQAALELGVPTFQPETLKDPTAIAWLESLAPDAGVVAAYGEILRKRVLAIPRYGYLNIHPSLLPLHRGPTPVPGAILAGEAETGVSIMLLEAKMDAGPLLHQIHRPLHRDDRAGVLTDELFQQGSAVLVDVLLQYASGALIPQPQDDSSATYTHLLNKTDGQIDWALPADQIERMSRAYDPWPGIYSFWQGQPFRILACEVLEAWQGTAAPGSLIDTPQGLAVATGRGALRLISVQPAGKRVLSAADWRRGLRSLESASLA